MNEALSSVTVISCSPPAWIETSCRMGEDLARVLGGEGYCVLTPKNEAEFSEIWQRARGAVILHTHGSAVGLYDDEGKGATPQIVSVGALRTLPQNPRIRLVVATACEVASGDPEGNVAAVFSRKIHSEGLVISNRFIVRGIDTAFEASEKQRGWVTYTGGRIVGESDELPAVLTMQDACRLWQQHVKRRAMLYQAATVSVLGCRNAGWAESSERMGRDLADAIGVGIDAVVKCPANAEELGIVWSTAGFAVIVHTYGTDGALCEDRGETMRTIADLDALRNLPQNERIHLVVITAGYAAGGNEAQNVASVLSERISPEGLVIACRGGVYGGSTEFNPCDASLGWTVYRNGKRICGDGALYPTLTMAGAYGVYTKTLSGANKTE